MAEIKEYIADGYFQVLTEDDFAHNGRVDIIISNSDFCFIVEAKILAPDQDEQMQRYSSILEQQTKTFKIPAKRCKLFYLTVDGKQPSSGYADFCITWHQMAGILNTFETKSNNKFISAIAKQYADYIRKHL